MCTVVFIPKTDKFFFASLRDESPLRPVATFPVACHYQTATVLSPVDIKAGGTWLGITTTGTVIILLNGGFEKHEKEKNYRKSRGLVVADLLASPAPVELWQTMNINNIEPFTLVVFNNGLLFQLIWDGKNKHGMQLNPGLPYIWSSVTLYDKKARTYRSHLFHQWTKTNVPVSAASVFDFFTSFSDSQNGFLINRNEETKTLSYTFIELKAGQYASMKYTDLLTGIKHHETIAIREVLQKTKH